MPEVLIHLVTCKRRWHHYILCMTFPVLQLWRGLPHVCTIMSEKAGRDSHNNELVQTRNSYCRFWIFPQIWYQSCETPTGGPSSNQLLLMSYSGLLFKLLTWARRKGIPDVLCSCIYLFKRMPSSSDVILFLFSEPVLSHLSQGRSSWLSGVYLLIWTAVSGLQFHPSIQPFVPPGSCSVATHLSVLL